MTEQELMGVPVLVHPQLRDDPAKRNGQIGIIIHADFSMDDFTIQFDDGSKGLYSNNALIIPKSGDGIYDYAVKQGANISHHFRQVLEDYACFIDYYGAEAQKGALKLVRNNEELKDFLTDPLEEMLEMKASYKIGR